MAAAMTVSAWTLYRFKLQMFLAPIRRHPVAAVALVPLAALVLAGTFAIGYFLPDTGFALGNLVETLALPLSLLAAVGLLTSPGGGMMLQPVEVDFVAVTPVTVRRFAFADAMFQATLFGVGLPALMLLALGYALRTGAPLWAALVPPFVTAASLVGYTFFLQALGIARLLRKRWAFPVALTLFAIFLAPAVVRIVFRVPEAYSLLPYPTTAVAQVALLPFGMGAWVGVPVLASAILVAIAASAWATNRPFLPNLRGTFGLAFTGEGKRLQQEALLRAFGRFRRVEGARVNRPTLRATMTVLHATRMARDGTLFLAAIFGFALGLPSLLAGDSLVYGGLYVAFFLPVASAGQWMISDRPNLWILQTSGARAESYFSGWWVALAAVVGVIAAAIGIVASAASGRLDIVGISAGVAGALGASAGAVFCAAKLPYAPNEFTVRPLVHMLLTAIFGGIAVLPIAALGFVLGSSALLLVGPSLAVLVASAWLFHKFVMATTKNPAL
jgi:hypothetical protein